MEIFEKSSRHYHWEVFLMKIIQSEPFDEYFRLNNLPGEDHQMAKPIVVHVRMQGYYAKTTVTIPMYSTRRKDHYCGRTIDSNETMELGQ